MLKIKDPVQWPFTLPSQHAARPLLKRHLLTALAHLESNRSQGSSRRDGISISHFILVQLGREDTHVRHAKIGA